MANRVRVVNFRITQEGWDAIWAAAVSAGVDRSEWLRAAVRDKLAAEPRRVVRPQPKIAVRTPEAAPAVDWNAELGRTVG